MITYITNQNLIDSKANKLPVFDIIKFKDEIKNCKQSFIEFEKMIDQNRLQTLLHYRATSFIVSKKVKSIVLIPEPQSEEFRRAQKKKKTSINQLDQIHKSGINIQELIHEFIKMTDQISSLLEFTVHTFLVGEEETSRILKFIEKKIWMNIIQQITFQKRGLHHLTINFGDQILPLNEFLNGHYMRIERIGEAYVEFFIKYEPVQKQQNTPSRLANILKRNSPKLGNIVIETMEKEEMYKKQNVFHPFESISYSNTSNYNICLNYYSFNQLEQVFECVNLREILNLYIADGFYKYQTTYMNSKLNLSDIHNICLYIIYKIQSQNFLNLTQYHLKPQKMEIIQESTGKDDEGVVNQKKLHRVKGRILDQDGLTKQFIFKKGKINYLVIATLIISQKQMKICWMKKNKFFERLIPFQQLEETIPFFSILLEEVGLRVFDKIIKIIGPLLIQPMIIVTEA